MSKRYKLELDMDAFWDIRNSAAIKADLDERTARVQAAAASGYEPKEWETNEGFIAGEARDGAERARAGVVTGNPHAARYAARHNTLLKALEAGRG